MLGHGDDVMLIHVKLISSHLSPLSSFAWMDILENFRKIEVG